MRPSLPRVLLIAVVLGLGLGACGDPDATRADLRTMLTERAEVPEDQAECIVDLIFEGDFGQDEINEGSRDPSKVDGFQQAIDEAIATCIPAG